MESLKRKGNSRWSTEEENRVKEVIFETVKNGGTQQAAFELLSKELEGRTAAGIGFLWNNRLRKIYKEEFAQIKYSKKKRIGSKKGEIDAKSESSSSVKSESPYVYADSATSMTLERLEEEDKSNSLFLLSSLTDSTSQQTINNGQYTPQSQSLLDEEKDSPLESYDQIIAFLMRKKAMEDAREQDYNRLKDDLSSLQQKQTKIKEGLKSVVDIMDDDDE
ncbi:hypothetical protein SFC65_20310 [Priestia filamentosa]|uniref:hypothetical protein n=1 Tax=Priestia filamentosa TaxID=1402861 RepID=UPI00398286AF